METKEEFKKVSEIVEHLLETNVRCRNDDKFLTYLVMREFTNIFIPFEDFNKMPAFETIKRVRAKIQNTEGRYPPTDQEVIEKRKHREEEVKDFLEDTISKVKEDKDIVIAVSGKERVGMSTMAMTTRGTEVKNTRGNRY